MSKLTQAQINAQKRYDAANKERRNYLRSRSAARSFIRTKASYSDLRELKEIIVKKEKEMENDYMYKLTAWEEGKEQSVEYFNSFEDLKEHLVRENYFEWINDEEPEKELPDFTKVDNISDIEAVFEEYDYDWWRMGVEAKNDQ